MVREFAGDYIRMGQTMEDRQDLLNGACSAWNMALHPPEERRKMLDFYVAEFRRHNPGFDEDSIAAVRENMETLIQNRLLMFPGERRRIVGAEIADQDGKDRINVAFLSFK